MKTILVHLPAYREPELVPTIKDCLANAKYPKRVHFGICRQFHPDDKFDNVDEFRDRKGFKVMDVPYEEAKGLPWARARINEDLLEDEDYILQLDSHHRFEKDWDKTLIDMHKGLKKSGVKKPLIGGYLPEYKPNNDPAGRATCPWQAQFACFYPHGTIFIRPGALPYWEELEAPPPARFLSGHFCFGESQWARDVLHDPDIFFSGEEINLSVRSYTHGYDIFHSHKLVIWHATMREERDGILVWDDKSKRGEDWWSKQIKARAKIRQLLYGEDNGFYIKSKYGLGTERSVSDYEKFAGINFAGKQVQQHTYENKYPPNPEDSEWKTSFYHLVNITRNALPGDDYKSILIAFDDNDGNGIFSKSIEGDQLQHFMKTGTPIHYEEFFLHDSDTKPVKMVAWAVSEERGWAERYEEIIS